MLGRLFFTAIFACNGGSDISPNTEDEVESSEPSYSEFISPEINVSPELLGTDTSTSSSADSDEEDESPITWTECDQWPNSHPCDFKLYDSNGDAWALYNNYGTVMVIEFVTMWCAVCNSIAPHVQTMQDTYTSRGYDFLWVTVIIEDYNRESVELSEAQAWVDRNVMTTAPVLVGSRGMIDMSGQQGYPISSWPTLVVIDDEMVLTHGINGWNESVILEWVEDALGL